MDVLQAGLNFRKSQSRFVNEIQELEINLDM